MPIITWGGLFTYSGIDLEAESDYLLHIVFKDVELLKDFHGMRRGTKFFEATVDLEGGKISFHVDDLIRVPPWYKIEAPTIE